MQNEDTVIATEHLQSGTDNDNSETVMAITGLDDDLTVTERIIARDSTNDKCYVARRGSSSGCDKGDVAPGRRTSSSDRRPSEPVPSEEPIEIDERSLDNDSVLLPGGNTRLCIWDGGY